MKARNYLLWGMVCALFVCSFANKAKAKSVYAVASHTEASIKAYLIKANKLEFQADVESDELEYKATGLCV